MHRASRSSRAVIVGATSFAGLVVTLLACASPAAQPELVLRCDVDKVGRYEKIEMSIDVRQQYTNPFEPQEVELDLLVETPTGKKITVPAFFAQQYQRNPAPGRGRNVDWFYPVGMPGWKARYAPAEIGQYRAVARLKDKRGVQQSAAVSFRCVSSAKKGYLRVSSKDPRYFELDDGTPLFAIGQNVAFIGVGQYVSLAKAEEIFAKLGQNGANYLRIWTCCEDWAMAIEARKSAFGRSWHWKPPLASYPEPDAPADRKCIRLEGDSLRIDPSHPVALRPNTKYVFSGRVKTEPGTSVGFEISGSRNQQPIASGADGRWVPFVHIFQTGPNDFWLPAPVLRKTGTGSAWIDSLSLKEAAGGPELLWEADPNRPVFGNYNQPDCFILDELVKAAEANGLYLQLCLLTRDLYMGMLKDPASAQYEQAIRAAKRTFRYAVARWGYSTAVGAWEYWNELDPGLPTERFYQEVGEYLEQIDPYRHLRTTSTWHPSPRDMKHPKLDIADMHYYFRPSERKKLRDEVDAVVDRIRFLRQNAPDKPALMAEFGVANEKFQPAEEIKTTKETVDFHNAMWASSLAGASGTCLFWWWERLDQRDIYPQYKPLAAFLADIPWTTAGLQPTNAVASPNKLHVVGLQGQNRAYLWLFNTEASWDKIVVEKVTPREVKGATVELSGLAAGSYRVQWWDTYAGKPIGQSVVKPTGGKLKLTAPPFDRDIACKITPVQ